GLHLPHLVRHQVGERRLLLLEQAREAEEDLAALRRGHEPPLCERLLGARAREDADRLAGSRARALERVAGDGVHPLATDEVLEDLRRRHRHAARLAARATDRWEPPLRGCNEAVRLCYGVARTRGSTRSGS